MMFGASITRPPPHNRRADLGKPLVDVFLVGLVRAAFAVIDAVADLVERLARLSFHARSLPSMILMSSSFLRVDPLDQKTNIAP
ncbi:MAG: hypothetical protein M5R36_08320 [Deltaproteobacteria bacterium]|nr:hypothetical protein [Deltaproteobacteria bacterium]